MRGWEQNASERNELPRERDAHRTKVVHRHTSQSAVETPLSQREKVGLQLPLQRNEDVFLLQTKSGSKQRGSNEIIRRTLSKCHHSYHPSTRQRNRGGHSNNNNNSAAAALNQSQSGRERQRSKIGAASRLNSTTFTREIRRHPPRPIACNVLVAKRVLP